MDLNYIPINFKNNETVLNEEVMSKIDDALFNITQAIKTFGNNISFDQMYPVGSIYQTINSEFNPNLNFVGTWERIKGKMLVGVDEDDEEFNVAEKTGGEKLHTLTIAEIPNHKHDVVIHSGGGTGLAGIAGTTGATETGTATGDFSTIVVGGGQAHNNMPPYETVYIWKRVA